MKDKIKLAVTLCDEIIDYFASMQMLTDEEEAMLQSAEWTKKELKRKEKTKKMTYLMVVHEKCVGTDFPPSVSIGVFSTREKAEHAACKAQKHVDGILKTVKIIEAEVN